MRHLLLAFSLFLLSIVCPAQVCFSVASPMIQYKTPYFAWFMMENNVLSLVKISLNKAQNSIVFNCPQPVKNVRVIVKHRGEVIIEKINNATISSTFRIQFSPNAPKLRYTVILQQDNHLLVERLDKNW